MCEWVWIRESLFAGAGAGGVGAEEAEGAGAGVSMVMSVSWADMVSGERMKGLKWSGCGMTRMSNIRIEGSMMAIQSRDKGRLLS